VCRVSFSFFVRPDSFSAVPRASGHVFKFCAPVHIFGGTEVDGSRCNVLRAQTRFRRARVRLVPFSCFVRPNSFSAVPRATGLVFMFCAPRHVFGVTAGIGSRFQILRSRTCFQILRSLFHVLLARTPFRRYRGHRVPFLSFVRPYSFSAVTRASGPVFIFCAPGLIFDGPESDMFRFHVWR
jgi:hypothetical protein